MRIIYSHGKGGFEGECWQREIANCSSESVTFVPFNHAEYVSWADVQDSVQLDRLYQQGDPRLRRLQAALREVVQDTRADALFVTNAPPYHPDFLVKLPLYKVLYSTDDPGATYKRTIPYVHAYDHLMYCATGYSADMDLGDKLVYAGARRANWLPLGVFDYEMEPPDLRDGDPDFARDIDVIYVGACYAQKLPLLAKVRRVFGGRVRIHGRFKWTHNAYLVLKHGYLGWVRAVTYSERVRLYRRAKIGFNIHWNEYGIGNQRLYHLPANGVMQVCDGGSLIDPIFERGKEVEDYVVLDELLEKIRYYLEHDGERLSIAEAGYERTMRDYRISQVNARVVELIKAGMGRPD